MSNQSITNPLLLIWVRIKLKVRSGSGSAWKWWVGSGPHQLTDDKPKCTEYEPIWALFQSFSLYLEARIRIRKKVKDRIRIRSKWQAGSGSATLHVSVQLNPLVKKSKCESPEHDYVCNMGCEKLENPCCINLQPTHWRILKKSIIKLSKKHYFTITWYGSPWDGSWGECRILSPAHCSSQRRTQSRRNLHRKERTFKLFPFAQYCSNQFCPFLLNN